MSKGQTLQDPFLNALRKDRISVSIFLVNGIKLQGQIESFDQYVVLLKNTVSQMVYKHAISTIVPTRNPRTGTETGTTGYQGNAYPMGGSGGFERGGYPTQRGGFTRTPSTGFEDKRGGFERQSYGNQGFEQRSGFERLGYQTGFDRSSFEERGFDGKAFEGQSTGFEFDKSSFEKKPFDDDYNND